MALEGGHVHNPSSGNEMLRPLLDPELNGQAVATKPLLCAISAPHIPASSVTF